MDKRTSTRLLFLKIASLFALFAVAFGAFGAHALQEMVAADRIDIFETGVRYQFYHAFGLFVIAFLMQADDSKILKWAAWLFVAGVFGFSGSLYLLSLRHYLGIESWWWIGPITPLGGSFFIIGWALMFWSFFKTKTIA